MSELLQRRSLSEQVYDVLIHDIEIPDVEMIQKQAREAQELLGKINEI